MDFLIEHKVYRVRQSKILLNIKKLWIYDNFREESELKQFHEPLPALRNKTVRFHQQHVHFRLAFNLSHLISHDLYLMMLSNALRANKPFKPSNASSLSAERERKKVICDTVINYDCFAFIPQIDCEFRE